MQAFDDLGSGSNPAIKTMILNNDGTEEEQIVFANYSVGSFVDGLVK